MMPPALDTRLAYTASRYLTGALILGAIYLATVDFEVGVAYAVAAAPLIAFSSRLVGTDRSARRAILVFSSLVIWAFFLWRPLFLIPRPAWFKFHRLGEPTMADMTEALYQLGLSFAVLLGVLALCLSGRAGSRPLAEGVGRLPPEATSVLSRTRGIVISGLIALSVADLVLTAAGVGVGGAVPASFTPILLLLPFSIVLPLSLCYLMAFGRALTPGERAVFVGLVLSNCGTLLLRGQKAFLLTIVFGALVLVLLRHGNVRVPVRRSLALIVGAYLATIIAFPIAMRVRGDMLRFGFGEATLRSASEYAVQMFDPDYLFADQGARRGTPMLLAVDLVSARMAGFDGLVAVRLRGDDQIESVFVVDNVIRQAAAKLLPGVQASGVTMGRAVSLYLHGHSDESRIAGAVGLVGSVTLLGRPYTYLAIIAAVFGGLMRWVVSSRRLSFLTKTLFLYLLSFQFASWLNGGNIDNGIQSMAIGIAHIALYSALLRLVVTACGRIDHPVLAEGNTRPVQMRT